MCDSLATLPANSPAQLRALEAPQLVSRLSELAAHIHAAEYELLCLIAEVNRRELWLKDGRPSCAHWLSWRCGLGMSAARERVRVAMALEGLPEIAEHLRRGELSYCKVRALTRVADANSEGQLLELARNASGQQLERIVRAYRGVLCSNESVEQQFQSRMLRHSYSENGSMVLELRLPPELGCKLLEAADQASPEPSEGDTRRLGARRVDGLMRIIDDWVEPQGANRVAVNSFDVVVHVDREVLETPDADGRAELRGSSGLAGETARRLCCDASVSFVDADSFEPIGRKSRVVPAALRRALDARDRGCRFPGCASEHRLHAHHIEHWANGGETSLHNLVSLCHFHHRQVHEGGYSIEPREDHSVVVRKAGETIPQTAPPARVEEPGSAYLARRNAEAGLDVTAVTCLPVNGYQLLDLHWTMACLRYPNEFF